MDNTTGREFIYLSPENKSSTIKRQPSPVVDETSRDSGYGQDEDSMYILGNIGQLSDADNTAFSPFVHSPAKSDVCFSSRSIRRLTFENVDLESPELFRVTDSTTPQTAASMLFEDHSSKRQTSLKRTRTEEVHEEDYCYKRHKINNKFRLDIAKEASGKDIKHTLDRVCEDTDLTGDGNKSYCLPTVAGAHQDLKSISSQTLTKVINHEYDDVIGRFVIVDCRYPYDYEGGHIKGSRNYYTREAITETLVNTQIKSDDIDKRIVIIFHCEFSSKRAPNLCRFLRSEDRNENKNRYPYLFYPEVYLLHGGYKEFYSAHKEFCCPESYVPMLDGDYKEDLMKLRVKSKSRTKKEKQLSTLRRGLIF